MRCPNLPLEPGQRYCTIVLVEESSNPYLRPMLSCLAALLLEATALDSLPSPAISQLLHAAWSAKDGAPADIRALAQSQDGYLWLGTGIGLFRFDGIRFVRFTPQLGDSLPGGAVARLEATRDGSVWIVWSNGRVSRVRQGRVTSYGERDGLPPAFDLAESSHDTLLAGTAKGLSRFAAGRWDSVAAIWEPAYREVRAVWFDRNDVLWVETEAEILYRPPGAPRFLNTRMVIRDQASKADFAQERDGTVWMNEQARSAHTLRLVGDSTYPAEVRVRATSVLVDRSGSLWVGSAGDGLRRVRDPTRFRGKVIARFGPEAEQYTTKDGLLSDLITALLEDREGSIWVASSRGLERFRKGTFTPIAIPGAGRSRLIIAAADSSIWTAAQGMTGVVRIGPRDTATVPTSFDLTNLAAAASGPLYTARTFRILVLQHSGFIPIPLYENTRAFALTQVTVDPAGTLWVFDENVGLLRVTRDRLIPVAPLYEPVARRGMLFSDRKGRIWVGQLNRVALYDHGELMTFGAAQGVPPGLVFQFLEDHGGAVWMVGEGGMSKFEAGRFRTVTVRRGLPGGTIFGVAEDAAEAWWIVTPDGVFRIARGVMDSVLADSTATVRYRAFDQRDGLPGAISVGGLGPPITRSADGRIWVAADRGVASVDPRTLAPPAAPPVVIEALRVEGRELPLTDRVVVPPASSSIEIDYTAATLALPERVQFRYRLEGQDPGWHQAGPNRQATYTSLKAGRYSFHVSASNGDGVWSEPGSILQFRVLPAWYQTLWFRSALALLIVSFSAGAAWLVQRRRHQHSQQALQARYEATLAERTRIAQDLHDTLLQGFAGVSLQLKAAERALPEEPDVAAETLMHVQRLTRNTLREARARVLDLNEPDLGHDLATALEASARELIARTRIELAMRTHGERRRLPRTVEAAALRIGREAIANAVRHAEPSRIEIVVVFDGAALRLEVRDDGRGFSLDQGEVARRHGHLGLTGMRDRAARVGGTCEVRPGPERGTVVAVELPLGEQ